MKKIKGGIFLVGVMLLGLAVNIGVVNAACCSTNCSTSQSSCSPENWYSTTDCSEIPSCPSYNPNYSSSASTGTTSGIAYSTSSSAQGAGWNIESLTSFGLPDASIYDIISNILYWLLAILGIAGVIGFAISGLMYLLAAGDEGRVGDAKKAMTASILGIIVGLSGLVIIQAVDAALNGFWFF